MCAGEALARPGEQPRGLVRQQVDVRLHLVAGLLAQAKDAQRHPGVVRGDGEMHGGAIACLLAARLGGAAIEDGGEEDRAALGVEVQHLRGIGREPEAVLPSPDRHVRAASPEHGDVERVDLLLDQDLGGIGESIGGGESPGGGDLGCRLSHQPLERPRAALLHVRGDTRQRDQRAELTAAGAIEFERGDVVLFAVVITGERGGAAQVDRPVGADKPGAGVCVAGAGEQRPSGDDRKGGKCE